MSDLPVPPASTSMQKLKQAIGTLNRVSDEAAAAVQGVEAFLTECGVNITASIAVELPPLDNDSNVTLGKLCFGEFHDKKRLYISEGEGQNDTVKPWVEWDRTTKLATFRSLPTLLDVISKRVLFDAKLAEEASGSIAQVLAFTRKQGGK